MGVGAALAPQVNAAIARELEEEWARLSGLQEQLVAAAVNQSDLAADCVGEWRGAGAWLQAGEDLCVDKPAAGCQWDALHTPGSWAPTPQTHPSRCEHPHPHNRVPCLVARAEELALLNQAKAKAQAHLELSALPQAHEHMQAIWAHFVGERPLALAGSAAAAPPVRAAHRRRVDGAWMRVCTPLPGAFCVAPLSRRCARQGAREHGPGGRAARV